MTGKHVILFAGTTEGRVLANWLDDQPGITGTVCVATEYGAELLTEEMPLKHLKVHSGRLDEDEIEAFLKKKRNTSCDRCNTSLCPGGHSQYPESL